MLKPRLQDLCVGIFVAFVGAIAFAMSFKMTETAQMYTQIVTGIFAVLGMLLIIQSIVRRNTATSAESVSLKGMFGPFVSLVLIVAYVVLMDVLGFFSASILFMVIYMLFLGARKPKSMIIAIAVMMVFIYILFTKELNVPLPKGLLI